jgi:hypothetical protein
MQQRRYRQCDKGYGQQYNSSNSVTFKDLKKRVSLETTQHNNSNNPG